MEEKALEYTTFPKQFPTYKWFKPLLVGLLTAVFTGLFSLPLFGVVYLMLGSMESLMASLNRNGALFYSVPGMLMDLGGVAVMLPALALAAFIVKDRPFSSYSSSRGGFIWGAYFKYVLVFFVVLGVSFMFFTLVFPDGSGDGVNKFSVASFIVFAVVVFIQAAAEEYVYRGLIMQTVGSWTGLPVVAVLVSTLLFAVSHTYGVLGIVSVSVNGIVHAFTTRYTRGLEVSCAAHGVHNFFVFTLSGLGITAASETDFMALVLVIVMQALIVAAVILIERKFHWCAPQGE